MSEILLTKARCADSCSEAVGEISVPATPQAQHQHWKLSNDHV